MSKENGLSKTIVDHNNSRPRSEGSWANAWVPVWAETPIASAANPHSQAETLDCPSANTPEGTPEMREVEKAHA